VCFLNEEEHYLTKVVANERVIRKFRKAAKGEANKFLQKAEVFVAILVVGMEFVMHIFVISFEFEK
jgi:hypothetical protein